MFVCSIPDVDLTPQPVSTARGYGVQNDEDFLIFVFDNLICGNCPRKDAAAPITKPMINLRDLT